MHFSLGAVSDGFQICRGDTKIMCAASDPRTFGLVLLHESPALEFALFSECLSYANRLSGRTLYTCDVIGLERCLFGNGCGVQIFPVSVPSELSNFDAVVVFGPARPPDAGLGEMSSWLRYQARQGALIGSIANGARAVARCGLLEGRRVALPRSSIAAFLRRISRHRGDAGSLRDRRSTVHLPRRHGHSGSCAAIHLSPARSRLGLRRRGCLRSRFLGSKRATARLIDGDASFRRGSKVMQCGQVGEGPCRGAVVDRAYRLFGRHLSAPASTLVPSLSIDDSLSARQATSVVARALTSARDGPVCNRGVDRERVRFSFGILGEISPSL